MDQMDQSSAKMELFDPTRFLSTLTMNPTILIHQIPLQVNS